MDTLTLVLLELALVEFLIVVIFVVLINRKTKVYEDKPIKGKKFSLREIEREADAITKIGKKLGR